MTDVAAHFLHLAPSGDFPDGIFIPYATQEDAERQATWEIWHGADPENFVGIFKAPHRLPPVRGWTRDEMAQHQHVLAPHLDPERRSKVHDTLSLHKIAPTLARQMMEEELRAHEQHILDLARAIRTGIPNDAWDPQAAVPGNAYTWCTGGTATAGAAALAAATAKTVLYIVAATANQPAITELSISFDGVTSSAVPVLVELISSTAGTAGTPRAALAAGKQLRGWPGQSSQTTCADTYSAEPGTSLVNKKWDITPNGGTQTIQNPLGREPTGIVTATTDAKAWGIRCTAPATVNCHAYLEFEE